MVEYSSKQDESTCNCLIFSSFLLIVDAGIKFNFPMQTDSKPAQVKRLQRLRSMANLTIEAFAEISGIPLGTLKTWESPKRGQVTDKGAYKLVEAWRAQGIHVSREWILFGHGTEPQYIAGDNALSFDNYALQTQEDIDLFFSQAANPCLLKIEDDAMRPMLHVGDYVGGLFLEKSQWPMAHNRPCIIETNQFEKHCRILTRQADHTLRCSSINPFSSAKQLVIEADNILRVALVLRTWAAPELSFSN